MSCFCINGGSCPWLCRVDGIVGNLLALGSAEAMTLIGGWTTGGSLRGRVV